MNRANAIARAKSIWPGRVQSIEPKPFHAGAWYVRLAGEDGIHMLDTDGRPDCHACCELAASLDEPQPDYLT